MLKAGVLGAGHLGKIHLRLLNESDKYNLIGFFDSDCETAKNIESEFGYKSFSSMKNLIDAVDMVVVATPTSYHFECAEKVIRAGKHLFIEKPIAQSVEEAEKIRDLVREYGVRGQVGQVERFNPAFMAVRDMIQNPMFIESHRLSEFNPRGTDVSVVLDLMIHDIDIILSVVQSKVKSVNSSGVSVLSETPDIANARIEFENGCVVNLTASRISLKKMRKIRFFQKDAYISVDMLEKKAEVIRMKNAPEVPDDYAMIFKNSKGEKKQIYFDHPNIEENNAIKDELESFADSIVSDTIPTVPLIQGTDALRVAMMVIKGIGL